MINVLRFKRCIVQSALEGKLSNRDSNDGNVDLLTKYLFKRNKKYAAFSNDLIEFNIPNEWRWCMLYEAVSLENGTPISDNKLPYLEVKYLRTGLNPTIMESGDLVEPGDKVILVDGENSGEIFPVLERGYRGSTFKVLRISNAFISEYVQYFISVYKEKFRGNKTGSAIPHLNKTLFFELPIPLPPIEEQRRIVERLNSIFRELDKVEKSQDSLLSLQSSLENKTIELALQGKLVKQVNEEGTSEEYFNLIQSARNRLIKCGKAKKYDEQKIDLNDAPFEIPESWKWVYLGSIFNHNAGKALNNSDKEGTELEYITTSNVYSDHFELNHLKRMFFKESEIEKCTIRKGDLLVLEGGDIGRAAIWNEDYEMRIQNHIHKLRPFYEIETEFFYYLLNYFKNNQLINGKGIGLQGLSSNKLHFLVVPLPPLNEQRRIVTQLKSILLECKKIV